jgi:hypothetical protein
MLLHRSCFSLLVLLALWELGMAAVMLTWSCNNCPYSTNVRSASNDDICILRPSNVSSLCSVLPFSLSSRVSVFQFFRLPVQSLYTVKKVCVFPSPLFPSRESLVMVSDISGWGRENDTFFYSVPQMSERDP